jgi:hypothetical protein
MLRTLYVFVIFLSLVLSSCTQRLICPAYQSAYIYDKETLRKKFSYFNEDSTPKILTASRTKYLIAVPESYRKKYKTLQTVEMKPVYPVIPDSLKIDEEADLLMAERDVIDSASIAKSKSVQGDTTYAITKAKEKYNIDQDIYMWYFRDMLVLPDVRAAMEGKKKSQEDEKSTGAKTEKKGFVGFFKNLFAKKDKSDSTAVQGPPAQPAATTPPAEKKGLFNRKKDTQQPAPAAPEKTNDAVKPEDTPAPTPTPAPKPASDGF